MSFASQKNCEDSSVQVPPTSFLRGNIYMTAQHMGPHQRTATCVSLWINTSLCWHLSSLFPVPFCGAGSCPGPTVRDVAAPSFPAPGQPSSGALRRVCTLYLSHVSSQLDGSCGWMLGQHAPEVRCPSRHVTPGAHDDLLQVSLTLIMG